RRLRGRARLPPSRSAFPPRQGTWLGGSLALPGSHTVSEPSRSGRSASGGLVGSLVDGLAAVKRHRAGTRTPGKLSNLVRVLGERRAHGAAIISAQASCLTTTH